MEDTIKLSPQCVIQVVSPRDFEKLAAKCPSHHRGQYYEIAECIDNGMSTILIRNAKPPILEHIDRDDAWHRRLELSFVLLDMLQGRGGLDPSELKHGIPLSLLTLLYREAFSANATNDDVLRIFTRNTQKRIEEKVAFYLLGGLQYDSRLYSTHGPNHPNYHHIDHFAWLYATQIQLVVQLIQAYPDRQITVVDLATGSGHFPLTLANYLKEKNLFSRVKLIAIDRSEHDMRYARELGNLLKTNIAFVNDDVESSGFPDRLRRFQADVIVANHILEHLPGEIQNRYLHDWLLAAKNSLSISVPLEDNSRSSISTHVHEYTLKSVEDLAHSMEIRVGFTVAGKNIEETKYGGLGTWTRKPDALSGGGFDQRVLNLKPKAVEVQPDPILQDFARPFDPTEFTKARKAPKIGEVQDKDTFQEERNQPRQIRQLPIKMPGTDVKLPREFAQLEEAVQIIINHNKATNPEYQHSYAYLNVFRGITLFSSYRGLSLNCHGDQLQSLQTDYAFKPDWSYIVSNTLPTILYNQSFDFSEALTKFKAGESINLYDYMNAQANEHYMYRSENFGIYLLSPYIVHSAAAADRDMYRVFMKIAFSTKRFFDNRELRRNPAFDYEDWYQSDTVGYVEGWFSHAHWNERFLKQDICPDWSSPS